MKVEDVLTKKSKGEKGRSKVFD